MALLTIACSNYNSERWIERYLNSLNEQLLPEFSVIIVDACSIDNSLNIIKQFKFRKGITPKIISLNKRIGYYEAFNLITDNCETEYIVSYNTDDHLYPAALTIINEYTNKYRDTDIFYSSFGITKNSNHIELGVSQVHIPPLHNGNVLMHACYIGPFSVVKKLAILDVGGYDSKFKICGDYDLWVRLDKANKKFTRIPEMIGSYYENPTGISTNAEDAEIRKTEELKIRLNKA